MPDTEPGTAESDTGPSGGSGSADSRERIMRATHCALCGHGYASLTMQDIADESDLSKAALHYHYDSKADLLRAFLDYLLDSFRERTSEGTDGEKPFERVRTLVGLLFEPPGGDADAEFRTALLELKAQAPYESPVRERLVAFDGFLRGELAEGIREAREAGTVRGDVDPEAVAEFVVTVANGAHTRRVALGRTTDCAETHLLTYLDGLRTGGPR
ncbi:TetR family transcriptional regulator [Halobacteriales archaeon QS_5_70_15]|nr:MAG: TetR family transcriptional regulator [Halobacteriales archaeon QS_5_70_15]